MAVLLTQESKIICEATRIIVDISLIIEYFLKFPKLLKKVNVMFDNDTDISHKKIKKIIWYENKISLLVKL